MATTTDYDAPRRDTIEDDRGAFDPIRTARADAQSPNVDLDESDAGDGVDLPGADLSGEELSMPVIPQRADEFHLFVLFPRAAPQSSRDRSRWPVGLRRLRLTKAAYGVAIRGR